ncbi:MAG: ribonuclease P protein component [Chloroflexi bacterium]|nr:ribonuclease P protein component [Chloroflexota bacterium]
MRAERLRRTRDIELVRRSGDVRSDRHFTVRSRRNGLDVVRVAVASPRAVGGAVTRSRARRRVREAIRTQLLARSAAPGTDLLVVTRAPAVDAPAALLREAVSRHLDAVLAT